MKRRTFVGTTAVVGGGVLTAPVFTGCAPSVEKDQSVSHTVRLTINGDKREVEVDTQTPLLEMLGDRVGLTGTEKCCDQGASGACTIFAGGERIVSCLTLEVMHEGAELNTIGGVAGGDRLHPLQQAFIAAAGLQCRHCGPGQIMSGLGCIAQGHTGSAAEDPGMDERQHLSLRCQTNIVDTIATAARAE